LTAKKWAESFLSKADTNLVVIRFSQLFYSKLCSFVSVCVRKEEEIKAFENIRGWSVKFIPALEFTSLARYAWSCYFFT
jgi:dTDP-4-dehydrorhamnose reductase